MMHDEMMDGMGWMMGGMAIVSLLLVVFLVTGIVYFIRNMRPRNVPDPNLTTDPERNAR